MTKSGAEAVVAPDLFYGEVERAVQDTGVRSIVVSNIADLLPSAKRFLGKLLKKVPALLSRWGHRRRVQGHAQEPTLT